MMASEDGNEATATATATEIPSEDEKPSEGSK